MKQRENNRKEDFIYELFSNSQDNDLNYIYRGQFSQNVTDSILSLAEKNIEQIVESVKIKKRVYFIMLECLQNITRYQPVKVSKIEESAIFVIQKRESRYYITTGNLILNERVDFVRSRLDLINSLDREELKKYYRKVLTNGAMTDEGGAGLGMIEMVRKSGSKLSYDFKRVDNKYSFFYYQTAMHAPTFTGKKVENGGFSLEDIMYFHQLLNLKDISLIYSSLFTQANLLSLVQIIERQMHDPSSFRKRFFSIMVEMFQNIIHHGSSRNEGTEGKPGIFFISGNDELYFLNAGNFVRNEEVEPFRGSLMYLNSLEEKELNEYYERRLFDFDTGRAHESGLGMIDMRIRSKHRLSYDFNKIDDKFSFFTLQVGVEKK